MAATGDVSARMERETMKKLLIGPPMAVKKLSKPVRKVIFEVGPVDNDNAVSS